MGKPDWRTYTHEEQRRFRAAGLQMMVQAEAYMEDADGICRLPMRWLAPTGLKAAPLQEAWLPKGASLDPTITEALAGIGYRFPLEPGDYVFSCCEGVWLEQGDVATEELFCCAEQDTTIHRLVVDSPDAPAKDGGA